MRWSGAVAVVVIEEVGMVREAPAHVRGFWVDLPVVGEVGMGAAANLAQTLPRNMFTGAPAPENMPPATENMAPRPQVREAGNMVRVEGWVVGAELAVREVRVFCAGSLIRTAGMMVSRPDVGREIGGAPERCGFATSIAAIELPEEFELEIFARFENETAVLLARIKGRRRRRAQGCNRGMQPLLVTSLGRMGTTYVMKLLAGHPEVVVEGTYPYEANAAGYWMHVMRVLMQGEVAGGGGHEVRAFDRGDWSVPPMVPAPAGSVPGLAGYVEGEYAEVAARFCREATRGFYGELARRQGKAGARYFCEKILPNGLHTLFGEVYGAGGGGGGLREIVLVRDFRDVACSIFAFNAKRGTLDFGREHVGSDLEYLPKLRHAGERLLKNYLSRRERALLVRYEELVERPAEVVRGILEYAGLEAGSEVIGNMVRRAGEESAELCAHRTAGSARESVGRWEREMSEEMKAASTEMFGELMEGFGYERERREMVKRE